ncbi:BICD family-like cargo adapter 2 [Agelaius tricolor]|uniref:BICD family-like cargo adapter 2 n=1 Tax=Agelaius tricolor TaxID=9191 RepID=UPI0039F22419
MAETRPGPPSAPSGSQYSQFPPPSLERLIPPSHFVLRPRSLGVELEAERGRVHDLEVELKALKGQSQHLGAELEAERRRSQQLEAELEAEKGRSQCLEAELKSERGRSQALGVELDALKGRGQRLEAELDAEKGRSQILEMELETLRGRGLGPEGAEPSPEQVLLGRWRQKVFQLLLQVRLQRGQELRLQGQVRSLGAAVAAGSRQVSLLELQLRQGQQERQALSQERLRAEAAEEELGKLGQALSRLLGTLGVALANVTTAIVALGTLSERLGRAQHRLQVLVASGRLQWQQEPEGTAGDSSTVAPEVTSEKVIGWHQGDTRGGSVPRVSPLCRAPQTTKGGDRTQPRPGTVSLAPLVMQLQALGAAILGDITDPAVPAPPWGHR